MASYRSFPPVTPDWLKAEGGAPLVSSLRLDLPGDDFSVSPPKTLNSSVLPKIRSVSVGDFSVSPNETYKNEDIQELNKQQRSGIEPDPVLLPEGSQTDDQDVVVFIQNMEKRFQEISGQRAGSLIKELVQKYGSNKVEEKIEMLAGSEGVTQPGGWLRTACEGDWHGPGKQPKHQKLSELRRKIEDLCWHLDNAINAPVSDFHPEPGIGKERVKTPADEKEWIMRNVRSRLGDAIATYRERGGKCEDVEPTEVERAVLDGFRILRSYRITLEREEGQDLAANILSSLDEHYKQFENYGKLIGFPYEEYQKAVSSRRRNHERPGK